MHFLLVRHEVADFLKSKAVFDSHAEAQKEAGLHVKHLLRNTEKPNEVFLLFEVEDIGKAQGSVRAPEASEAGQDSGVVGTPDIYFLA